MGYMGFGLQKWIYKHRPRRLFSKDRKPSGDTIPKYSIEFKPRKHNTKYRYRIKVGFAFLLIIACAVLLVYSMNLLTTYSLEINTKKENIQKKQNNEAYLYLLKSAKEYYNKGEWEKAKSELELALNLEPDELEANKFYIQILLVLCKQNKSNCSACLDRINKMIFIYPDDTELYHAKVNYYLLIGDTLNATIELEKLEKITVTN